MKLYGYSWDTNYVIDTLGLKGERRKGKTKKDGTPYNKPGPKIEPDAPHNKRIREWGDEVEAKKGTVLSGGGRAPETEFETPGGKKGSRRPDII